MKTPIIKADNHVQIGVITRALYAAGYTRDDLPVEDGVKHMVAWKAGVAYIHVEGSSMYRKTEDEYEDDKQDHLLVNSVAQMVRYLKSRP